MSLIPYALRVSPRAKHMRITIHADGSVVVVVPAPMPRRYGAARRSLAKEGGPRADAERFVAQKSGWIREKLAYFQNIREKLGSDGVLKKISRGSYKKYKEGARALAEERIAHFNAAYGFSFKKISIRNQKTRWGSCSRKGNLSFNYKIALLPQRLADYIIVHELCHLAEFNHSRKFWNLVARAVPDHLALRKELKAQGWGM